MTLPLKSSGKFTMELNKYQAQHTADADLRYYPNGVSIFGKYYTVGGATYDRLADMWNAYIDAPYDEESDSDAELLGVFTNRHDAIEAVWRERERAQLPPRAILGEPFDAIR